MKIRIFGHVEQLKPFRLAIELKSHYCNHFSSNSGERLRDMSPVRRCISSSVLEDNIKLFFFFFKEKQYPRYLF